AGRRLYDENHLKRLSMVRNLRSLRFSVPEVRVLLSLLDRNTQSCTDAREIATAQRDRLRAEIAAAQALESLLSRSIGCCEAACAVGSSGITLQGALANMVF
ncbi:MAG TPA: MerR family DNA-binding protein, partial [Rhizomicrobium sp.]|nr:MerR family DNA-binding protein [Rhizomicrobium sp.]